MKVVRRVPAVWLASALYAVVLSAAAIHRHHNFQSGGYDLGIFDQATWLMGHGLKPFSTIRGRYLLADHFQPALYLLAPLGRFGLSPIGLLILQSVLLAAVAPLLYRLAAVYGANRRLALAVSAMWLASPLTQWANLFDYHPETAVPLLLVAGALLLERRRVGLFAVTALIASSTKEDVCLVYVMWALLLVLQKNSTLRRLGFFLGAAGIVWFALATQVAIPALGGNLNFYSERFGGDRGSSIGSVAAYLVDHPGASLDQLATSANAKILIALIVCTGGLAVAAPRFLLLAVPGLAANLLSAYSYQHDLHFHYQLVPATGFALASAAGAGVVALRVPGRLRDAFALILIAGAIVAAVVSPAVRGLHQSGNKPTLAAKREALSFVPPGVPVAAAPDLVPHLSHRRAIYQLPEPFFARHGNGEYWTEQDLARRSRAVVYVVIDLDSLDPFPREQTSRLPPLLERRGYVQIFRRGDIRVFRRVARGS
jgi:uncharacterized membrane protein